MKNFKKAFLMVLCVVAIAGASIFGTLAYLTSNDSVTNTFTVGKIAITLDEEEVDIYGDDTDTTVEKRVKANTYKLIPGHNYLKDPTVHLKADSENCWLFIEVVNPIAAYEAETTIANQILANGWTELSTGVYYKEIDMTAMTGYTLDSTNKEYDIPVFGQFTLKDDAEIPTDLVPADITVKAYAIQRDGFDVVADAYTEVTTASTNG